MNKYTLKRTISNQFKHYYSNHNDITWNVSHRFQEVIEISPFYFRASHPSPN